METEGVDDSFKKFGRGSQERKGRELERVADSSRSFLRRETSQYQRQRDLVTPKLLFNGPVPQANGARDYNVLTNTPKKRVQLLEAEL